MALWLEIGGHEDINRSDIQVVKCVLVGDSGVGKTRLTCARACGTRYTLQELVGRHVPTVWAIDHYRKDKEVLRRSWCDVDSLNVSLRLWDTFGYHDKNRRFAYGRADVVVVCFSVLHPRSLRNVVTHWYPEVCELCPGAPIILCGCQIDLRYLYMTERFKKLDKGPFFREIKAEDVLTPDKGRAVAKEIGATYYESSALVPFGVEDVFLNAVRSALVRKRERHFWNQLGSLKRIGRPACQEPHMPPKPSPPDIIIPPPEHAGGPSTLLESQSYCDLIFVCQGVCIQAHKAVLLAAAPVFAEIFKFDLSVREAFTGEKSESDQDRVKRTSLCLNDKSHSHLKCLQSDTITLLDNEETDSIPDDNRDSGCDILPISPGVLRRQPLDHPAFVCIESQPCDDVYACQDVTVAWQTVVTLSNTISAAVFQLILRFLYTGQCEVPPDMLLQMHQAAQLLELKHLMLFCCNLMNNEDFMNDDITSRFNHEKQQRIKDLLVDQGLLSDISFHVDDGIVAAHKALLIASCDVMAGMFSYNFRESSADVIEFPGTTKKVFSVLQEYLYTGMCPSLLTADLLGLIELANRLCLPRLLAHTEQFIVQELSPDLPENVMEHVILLVEPAQMHNATQLASWCLWFLSSNYQAVYHHYSKLLQSLRPDIQVQLSQHRWPPMWYIKEVDVYEKQLVDLARMKPLRPLTRRDSDDLSSGCLGFCSRKNRRMKCANTSSSVVSI